MGGQDAVAGRGGENGGGCSEPGPHRQTGHSRGRKTSGPAQYPKIPGRPGERRGLLVIRRAWREITNRRRLRCLLDQDNLRPCCASLLWLSDTVGMSGPCGHARHNANCFGLRSPDGRIACRCLSLGDRQSAMGEAGPRDFMLDSPAVLQSALGIGGPLFCILCLFEAGMWALFPICHLTLNMRTVRSDYLTVYGVPCTCPPAPRSSTTSPRPGCSVIRLSAGRLYRLSRRIPF